MHETHIIEFLSTLKTLATALTILLQTNKPLVVENTLTAVCNIVETSIACGQDNVVTLTNELIFNDCPSILAIAHHWL